MNAMEAPETMSNRLVTSSFSFSWAPRACLHHHCELLRQGTSAPQFGLQRVDTRKGEGWQGVKGWRDWRVGEEEEAGNKQTTSEKQGRGDWIGWEAESNLCSKTLNRSVTEPPVFSATHCAGNRNIPRFPFLKFTCHSSPITWVQILITKLRISVLLLLLGCEILLLTSELLSWWTSLLHSWPMLLSKLIPLSASVFVLLPSHPYWVRHGSSCTGSDMLSLRVRILMRRCNWEHLLKRLSCMQRYSSFMPPKLFHQGRSSLVNKLWFLKVILCEKKMGSTFYQLQIEGKENKTQLVSPDLIRASQL